MNRTQPLPLSFIPPIPTWGAGDYARPEAVVVRLESSCVSDPTQHLGLFVELLSPYFEDNHRPEPLEAFESTRRSKSVAVEDVVLTLDSLLAWWRRGSDSASVMAESRRIKAVLYQFGEQSGSAFVTLMSPGDDEIAALVSRTGRRLAGMDGWHGFVGLGSGWASVQTPVGRGTVLGYGPVVVADRSDFDTTNVDKGLVRTTELADGVRLLAETLPDTDLVNAVSEIRRISWPGWGFQSANSDMAGSLYLEGGWSQPPRGGLRNLEQYVQRTTNRLLRTLSASGQDPVIRDSGSGRLRLRGDSNRFLADLSQLVAAWRRGANALTPQRHIPKGELVFADIASSGSDIEVRHGPCSVAAIVLLEQAIADWSRIFGTEAPGPLHWNTGPAA